MTVIVAMGTFDLLHAGHRNYFEQAKKLGDILIVIVARDDTTFKIKRRHTMQNEYERLKAVSQCEHVDLAVLGLEFDKLRILEILRPDSVALGYDQKAFTEDLQKKLDSRGMNVKVVRLEPFEPDKYKTSIIRGGL